MTLTKILGFSRHLIWKKIENSSIMDRITAVTDVIQVDDPKMPGRINPMAPRNVQNAIIYSNG
jgi:hypothetical protein